MPSIKREAIVECIASDNVINDDSYKIRLITQDGFIVTGETSKSLHGKGINSFPDLNTMINCTKSNAMLSDVQNCIEKVCKMSRLHLNQGECVETKHNSLFKIDVLPDNIDRELKFTCNQCHLMMSGILCHSI